MTSADPTGRIPRPDGEPRMPSAPPPLYQPSDEIPLDDPIGDPVGSDAPAERERRRSTFDGPEPVRERTREDQRPAGPFRAFWLTFAANSSVAGIVVGGVLFTSGMSLRQTVVAGVIGVVLAGLLLVAVDRIGRRSGLPVLSASAAVFGRRGSILPVGIVLVARIVVGGVLLWVFGSALARVGVLTGVGSDGAGTVALLVAVGAMLCCACAAAGYRGIVVAQRVLAPLAGIALLWFVVATLPAVDLRVTVTIGDGPGVLLVSGVVTVLVLAGLLLLPAAGDTARFQRTASAPRLHELWTALGAAVPVLLIVTYGTILAASAPETADGLATSPVDAVVAILPAWFPVPLAIAITVGTLPGVILSLYSASLTVPAAAPGVGRAGALAVGAMTTAGVGIALSFAGNGDTAIDLVTTVAVPLAAVAGVLVGRSIAGKASTGPADAGARPTRWIPVGAVLFAAAIGFGLTTATAGWLSWQGFLFPLLGTQGAGALAASDPGILVALLLATLVSIPRRRVTIRQQTRGTHRRP